MTTFISIRVSTREQYLDGLSLPTQIRECLAYCRLHGLEDSLHPDSNCGSPGVFADPGVSAWKCRILERPGFLELWRRAKPGDSIVFFSMDRAFRSVRDFSISIETFREKQVLPVFTKGGIRFDTAAGSLWARVLAAFAEYQSELLSERMREFYAIQKAHGKGRWKGKGKAGAGAGDGGIGGDDLSALEECATGQAATKRQKRSDVAAGGTVGTEFSDDIQRMMAFSGGAGKQEAGITGRIIRYARVSTDEQNPQTQLDILQKHMGLYFGRGYTDGGEFVDHGVSAFYRDFRDRPAGGRICEGLQPGDVVLVTRLDRIFRSTIDMGTTLREWDTLGISFADASSGFDTSTVDGRMMATFMCVMAQWESEMISYRVSLGMKAMQQEKGPWGNGRLPLWVRKIPVVLSDGSQRERVEVIPEVMQDILFLKKMRQQGLSIAEISDTIQREYEIKHDIPVKIPMSGIGNRWVAECKLRREGRYEDVEKFRAWCEKNGIGKTDEIPRVYSNGKYDLWDLVKYSWGNSGFGKYLEANE